MAATSPYSQNDYQAVSNFRPHELPINDIFKAFSAQNQFWNAGAERVKAYYDNALNLKLSLEPNKEIRKKYMEDAEKQLTKLSSMDLADPTVQRQGFALFKPLFQDEGIIYDDLTTRHYEKVRNDALMYRSKDNGKGYSDINFQYAMNGYNEFLNSQDRMAGKDFYQNRKEYTPYYDYTDDFSQSLKDCKPSSVEAISPVYNKGNAMSGYMQEVYSKSLSAGQVQNCLEAGLSPNAKRQLQIEGAVSYRGNIPTLASDTATYLSGVSGNYATQLQQLNAEKAAILNKKDMSDKEKAEAIAIIDQQSTALGAELDRTNNSIKKLNAGDFTDVQNNFENYASSVYSYKKLYKKAMASAFEERKSNYKADPVQLNAIRFEQQKYLNQMDFQFDVSLEQMKQEHDQNMKLLDLMYGGKDGKNGTGSYIQKNPFTGEYTVDPNLMRETGNSTDKPDVNKKIYEELANQASVLSQEDNTNSLILYNNLISRAEKDNSFRETLLRGFNYGTTDDEWARFKADHNSNKFTGNYMDGASPIAIQGIQDTPWFRKYTESQPDDKDVNKWAYDNSVIKLAVNTLNRKVEIAEKQVASEIGGDFMTQINKGLSEIKPVRAANGMIVTAQDMQSVIEGRPVKGITVSKEKFERDYGNRGLVSREETVIRVDGKVDGTLTAIYNRVQSENEGINSKLRKKRVEVYNNLGFDREPWFKTPEDKGYLVESIKSIIGTDKDGKEIPVRIISSDFSGGVKVSIPGKTNDQIINALRGVNGLGTSVEVKDGIATIRGTTHNVIPQAIQNPLLKDAAYQLNTIAETTAFAQTQPGAKVPNSDIEVPVMVAGKQQILTIETYKDKNGPIYRVFTNTPTGVKELFTPSSNPYELFEKIGRSPMDLNKPIR